LALRRAGRADEADALAAKALAFKPDEADYHYGVGAFLLNSDLNEEAITEFETGLAAAADNEWLRAWCTRGIGAAHVQMEQYERAADEYEQAIGLFRTSQQPREYASLLEDASWAFYNLGRYYELRGRHEDTIAANERALKLLPAELDVELGLIATQNLVAIGEAYVALDKPKDALAPLERARDLAPDAPGIYTALGDAYKKLGEDAKAADAYRQCEELYRAQMARQPDAASPYNNLAWFLVTHDLRLDEALELSQKSIELAPDTDAYLDTLAEIHYRRGEHDKAIEAINKVFDLDPKPRHLIYFEQQRDKFEKAKKESG
jgi:tetratricopeptide (TPR) repeat protein